MSEKWQRRNYLLRYTTVGLEFAIIVGLFVWIGFMLDRRFQITPVLTVWGTGIGFGVGIYRLVRIGRELQRMKRQGRSGETPSNQDRRGGST